MKLAIIMTCHNRRKTTVSTIQNVLGQVGPLLDTRVFILDAASEDGTAEVLHGLDPKVHVLHGTSSDFWARGMRKASAEAVNWEPDWIMLLNDDVELRAGIMNTFFDQIQAFSPETASHQVIVGEIHNGQGELVYGARHQSLSDPFSFQLDQTGKSRIDTFNGNVVFIGKIAYAGVGGFPLKYRHGYADFVLGLRLSRAGFHITRLNEVAGVDLSPTVYNRMYNGNAPLAARIKFALSPFGIPFSDHRRYCQEVSGPLGGLVPFVRSYGRVLFPKRAAHAA